MNAATDPAARARALRIRAMTLSDLPLVGNIERHAYPFPWSEGIFRDCLRVGYLCRVAEVDGEVAAYGVVAFGPGEAHILNVCVSPALRGQGIGRQLLRLLLERCRDAAMTEVFLEVRPSNTIAIALYESLGFVEVGLRKAYYQAEGGREDARVLRLTMPGPP